MRFRTTLALIAGATIMLLGQGGRAYAAGSGLGVEVRSGEGGGAVVVLTNNGTQPCQVVSSAEGTIQLTGVAQDGHEIEPTAILPSYDDDLGYQLSKRLKTLAPAEALDLPLPIVAAGSTGHALRTVSWSPLATIGALFPIDPARAIDLRVAYASPVVATAGAPMCAVAEGSGSLAPAGGASRWVFWAVVGAGAVVVLLAAGVLVFWLTRRRGRAAASVAGAVALLIGIPALVLGWPPAPAHATIAAGPGAESAVAGCLASMRKPGGDPRGILSRLDDPSVNVTISLSGSNGENRVGPKNIFVYWNPNDTSPFGDGVARDPCDELYHEMYHGFEDATPQGVDVHECFTADGKPTGISIKEVNATKAENARRAARGAPQRTVYGDNKLPAGDCRPSKPDDPVCHPSYGCPKPEQKKPASTGSDPHLVTFDGRRYDFQGRGEFVAVRDTTADPATALQIQVRQLSWRDDRFVTMNTAVAANVNGDRVEARLDSGHVAVLVNGVPRPVAPGASPTALPKGGDLRYTPRNLGDMLTIDWPDTSYVLVASYGHNSLTLIVWTAPAHAGTLAGLLGDADGNSGNDVKTKATGTDPKPTYDDLYPAYSDRMRITNTSSLFTYPAGANTDTYTDRTFPDREPPEVPRKAWAESLCRQFGITDPVSLADCGLDIAHTGSADFIGSSLVAQSLSAGLRLGGSGASAAITRPGEVSTVSFAGVAGQKLYVDVVSTTLPSACGVLALKDPAGQQIGSGCVINGKGSIDTVTLPSTGTYTVVIDPPGDATGQITLRLVSATDQQSGSSIGTEATLTVAQPGAVGRLAFPGRKGQFVYVDVISATVPSQCGVLSIRDAANHEVNNGCVINGKGFVDRTELPADGTYTLALDPADNATGAAHVRLTEAIDQRLTVTAGGPEVTATVAQPGAVSQLTFSGTAGEKVFVDVGTTTINSQCGAIQLRDPAGTQLNNGCVINGKGFVDRTVLAVAGTYTITVDPAEAGIGTARIRLVQATDQEGTLTIGGPAATATVAQSGAIARFTFTGSAGQSVVLDATASTLPGACGVLFLDDVAGAHLASGCVINGAGGIAAVTLPAAGTYAIVVDPTDNSTGQVSVRLHT